jgi:outer membrane protein assembly factor BamB
MLRLPRSLASGAAIALTLVVATACGDESNPDVAADTGSTSVALSDLEFAGDQPLAWPHVDVCDTSVIVSENPLTGEGDAAIFDPETGEGHTVEVHLPDDSTLDPGADWRTSLDCVSAGDGSIALAQYAPVMLDGDAGSAWAAFDAAGKQLWVREFEGSAEVEVANGLIAFRDGSLDDDSVEWRFVDPISGDESGSLESPPLESLTPVSSGRYVTTDGLLDLSGEVVNPDVTSYDVTGFGQGTRLLAEGLDLTAYDTETGERLWTSKVPDPFTAAGYDDRTKTLVWTSSDEVGYGVDAETGEKLWSYQLPSGLEASMSDVFAAGSGVAIVGAPTLGRPLVLDLRSGEPIDVPDGTHVIAAGPAGVAVVEDGKLTIVDGSDLG